MLHKRRVILGICALVLVAAVFAWGVQRAFSAVSAPHYVTDPAECPDEDEEFPGQKCPYGTVICGVNDGDIPQCYDPTNIAAPVSSASSNTQYTASLGGGYIIDCYAQPLDSAAPYCDNNGSAYCNRSDTCYTDKKRATTCTAGSFGAFACGNCRTGYQDCLGDDVCEVTTGVTNYPNEDNSNYAASCTAQCDSGYLDCNVNLGSAVDGCEIDVGGICGAGTSHAVFGASCDGTSGDCNCSSGYLDCNADLTVDSGQCEIQVGGSCGGASSNAIYGASCDGASGDCGCSSGYLDCNVDLTTTSGQCEIQVGGSCGTNAIYQSSCDGTSGDCQCSSGYYDCNSSGPDAGDGCEVQTATVCTTDQGVTGVYSGCTCVPDKSYFETGTDSVYSSQDPLLWGAQMGTGKLMSFSNAVGEQFAVFNSGAVKIGTTTEEEAGILRFTGADFEGFDGSNWVSFTGGGASQDTRYVDVQGDTMTGGLIISGAGLTASGTIATESGLVLNLENEAKDSVIVFGHTLGQETLKFKTLEHRFEFSDDLHVEGNMTASGTLTIEGETLIKDDASIQGDLTVTGLINGVDITALSSDTATHLKVSSGAGLLVSVAGGDYRLSGTVTQYAGDSDVSVADDVTNYLFFTSTGLTVTVGGFPTDKVYIPLATVQTSGGGITAVVDRRVFNSDDRERTVTRTFEPQFEAASYHADGSDNVGQLLVHHSGSLLRNYYTWASTRSALQDYDVRLKVVLPDDFVRWASIPLSVDYRTTSASPGFSKLDVAVYDTAGNVVTLSGTSTDLANLDWTTTQLTFTGSPTWSAGEELTVVIKLSAKDQEEAQLGTVKIGYVELLSE
ncbi:hypothetical protein COU80_00025 [Candidatus Peregrinibacteria bacterium CG10_big_fil_rev_8_21_14_0_10_55_24]|nr:MAG: hypothetical protein COU80_00025 [Candidatus Peregrinibacteria bacterium CG10_big_fil_rev_8_21_14_0_10_55_24]